MILCNIYACGGLTYQVGGAGVRPLTLLLDDAYFFFLFPSESSLMVYLWLDLL